MPTSSRGGPVAGGTVAGGGALGDLLAYGHVEQVPLQVVTAVVCALRHAAPLAALLVLTPAAPESALQPVAG